MRYMTDVGELDQDFGGRDIFLFGNEAKTLN
jgi:hypothetical protein